MKNKIHFGVIVLLALVVSMPLQAALVHQYSFDADASDSVGTADGTLEGATVANGKAETDGAGAYVDLPADVIAINTLTTGLAVELWSTQPETDQSFSMTACFGDTWPDGDQFGKNYLMISTTRGDSVLESRGAIAITPDSTEPWNDEKGVNGPELNDATEHHYVLVIDDPAADGTGSLYYYIDGELQGSVLLEGSTVAGLDNTYAYLGKGLYVGDGTVNCSINEYRIHDAPLSQPKITLNYQMGPDQYVGTPLESMTPANGASNVAWDPQASLSWTVDDSVVIDHYEVMLSTDPNLADPNQAQTVALIGSPTDPSLNYASLSALTTYSWRVDAIESGTMNRIVGPAYTFTTAAEGPIITADPAHAGDFENGSVSFTAVCQSSVVLDSFKWYEDDGADGIEMIDDGVNVVIVNEVDGETYTSTLTLNNITLADEGGYYAVATNSAGSIQSATAQMQVKRLLAYWPFDGDPNDASASGDDIDGTVMGAVTYEAGQIGQAVNMDGSAANYIELPAGLANFTTGLTINVWANPASVANWARFLTMNNGENADNLFFCRNGTSQTLQFSVYKGATNVGLISSEGAIDVNEWQMFTVTLDENADAILYKNGLEIASENVGGLPDILERTQNWIGKSAWPDSNYNGLLDEMRLFNYAITADDVADLYVEGVDSYCRYAPAYDVSGDCKVNLDDFALVAGEWLDCGIYPDTACD